mmetsp:Transcript_117243/g.378354  ORF Transcript_117243/g.378354 Transcript_117243/m.378354 type:complete len:214 (+) Transcript_117243:73-714(+)
MAALLMQLLAALMSTATVAAMTDACMLHPKPNSFHEDLHAESELVAEVVDLEAGVVDEQVSLLQVGRNLQRGRRSLNTSEWFTSPLITMLCDSSYVRTPEGTMTLDSPCKSCVSRLSRAVDLKYVTVVAETPTHILNTCEDGPFDGCNSCELLGWLADDWFPQSLHCCAEPGAGANCHGAVYAQTREVVEKRALLCHVSPLRALASAGMVLPA